MKETKITQWSILSSRPTWTNIDWLLAMKQTWPDQPSTTPWSDSYDSVWLPDTFELSIDLEDHIPSTDEQEKPKMISLKDKSSDDLKTCLCGDSHCRSVKLHKKLLHGTKYVKTQKNINKSNYIDMTKK